MRLSTPFFFQLPPFNLSFSAPSFHSLSSTKRSWNISSRLVKVQLGRNTNDVLIFLMFETCNISLRIMKVGVDKCYVRNPNCSQNLSQISVSKPFREKFENIKKLFHLNFKTDSVKDPKLFLKIATLFQFKLCLIFLNEKFCSFSSLLIPCSAINHVCAANP